MKYRYLNEVLLNWNSDKNIQDNSIIKSSDIKKQINQCFIYKIRKTKELKIFDLDWPELDKYKDKIYINGKHIELDDSHKGYTLDEFKPGEYRVYIEDIDQITNCKNMFYECTDLISVPLFDTSRVKDMSGMFNFCSNLKSVPKFDVSNVINMSCMFSGCKKLKSIPLFDIEDIDRASRP